MFEDLGKEINTGNAAFDNGMNHRRELLKKLKHRGYKRINFNELSNAETRYKNKKIVIEKKPYTRKFGEEGTSGYVLRTIQDNQTIDYRLLPMFQQTSGTAYTKLVEQMQCKYDEDNLIVVYDGDFFTTDLINGIKKCGKELPNKNVQVYSINGLMEWIKKIDKV